mgnify:CR=1 FL=1
MQAWLCENPVGVDALQWKELPTPTPGPGEVLIAIEAASLNFPDLLIVQNKYQMKPPLPFVPGSEYAGVVAAVGDGVTHLKVGQNVACLSGTGGFGTHTIAPAALCMPLPDGFSHVDAAAFIMIYATSYHALVDRAQLKAGETVLVSAASGAVGSMVVQLAKRAGARVIGSTGSADKVAYLKTLGADEVINYRETPDLDAELARLAPDGIHVYFENVGGAVLDAALNNMAVHGRIVMCGLIEQYNSKGEASGPRNLSQVIRKRLTMQGLIVFDHWQHYGEFLAEVTPAFWPTGAALATATEPKAPAAPARFSMMTGWPNSTRKASEMWRMTMSIPLAGGQATTMRMGLFG